LALLETKKVKRHYPELKLLPGLAESGSMIRMDNCQDIKTN